MVERLRYDIEEAASAILLTLFPMMFRKRSSTSHLFRLPTSISCKNHNRL